MSDDTASSYTLKTAEEIAAMRAAGLALAATLLAMKEAIVPGKTTTLDLDRIAGATLAKHGAKSALLGYKPGFSEVPYMHNTCISLADEVIHGVPSGSRVIREGDLVSLDCAAMKDGWCADSTISVLIGKRVSQKAQKICQVTRDAMYAAIAQAHAGNTMGDVSGAMQRVVEKNGMSVVRDLVGHGIGRTPHEEGLDVPCYAGSPADDVVLEVGMTFCIEPMVIYGDSEVLHIEEDPWTIVSADGSIACHWEHTIVVTETGPVVLTAPPKR
jgi:methionyl aminopeptidase